MKIVAIIQARMGSERLPDKVLAKIEDRPMLWHIAKRVRAAKLINEIVIATSMSPRDLKIENSLGNEFKVFRGSEQNCLDRYYRAASEVNADVVVRITGDCPLICPEIIDKVISGYLRGNYDYVTNTLAYTYPEGCDVEVFSFKALEKAWKESSDSVSKEHVTPYLRNSGKFKVKNILNRNPVSPNEFKWSVDRVEDLEFVREVFRYLYKNGNIFSMEEIISFLKKNPQVKMRNAGSIINEGYYRSLVNSSRVKPKKINIYRSLNLKKKAEKIIPGCSQTFSKGPSQFVQGVAPVFLERGKGSHVWDVDGNEYIDYAMALGPVILGHNYPAVTMAVKDTLVKGTTYTLPHSMEVELSEMLCEIIPCAQMVRFGKNGSDVTAAAVRVARAFTGRDKIACCGYHGWQDWYIATTTRSKGIPEAIKKLTLTFDYNRIESLQELFRKNKNQIAAVIMEPLGIIEPQNDFLAKVKELTHENGALLVFDEVVTGFRISLGGAQEYFGVIPDLACFGKAMGNGFPISAIVGRKDVMKLFEEIFFSFTFGGEIISIASAIATIKELADKQVIRYLWEQGRKIKDGYNILVKEYDLEKFTRCIGFGPRTVITFKDQAGREDLLLKSLFQQECIRRGVLFCGGHNISFSHSNTDIDHTLRVYSTVLKIIKKAINKNNIRSCLKGKPLEPVFRKA